MVFFTCNACGESVKKIQVEKHVALCRNCECLSCIDCGQDFWGDDYKNHVKCISEDQKYGGKGYEGKTHKGDTKQQAWLQKINELTKRPNVSPKVKELLQQISGFDNVPRKKAKFQNWMKNSLKVHNESVLEQVWSIFSEASSSEPVSNKGQDEQPPEQVAQPQAENSTTAQSSKANDILRKKGILPSKESLTELEKEAEEEEQQALQQSIVKTYEDMTLEELEDNEDEFNEEDERAIEMYRQQRLAEWKATQMKNKFGEVLEISGKDYVQEVTKAGEGLWVILHLYKQGIPLCALINQHFSGLARKFPDVKFIKAISTTCIPNYPDRNLPTIFVYLEGDIKAQFIGPLVFGGMNLTMDELEWKLSESGAIKTSLEENPKKPIEDMLLSSVRGSGPARRDSDSDDD